MNVDQAILPELSINDTIVFYAFRYCLGRRSYAVDDCVAYLEAHWTELLPRIQRQIQVELRAAIEQNAAGDACDVVQWQRVLALPVAEGGAL
jgi:hypothetical protein